MIFEVLTISELVKKTRWRTLKEVFEVTETGIETALEAAEEEKEGIEANG